MQLSERSLSNVAARPTVLAVSPEWRLSIDPRPRRARYYLERFSSGEWYVHKSGRWLPKVLGFKVADFHRRADDMLPGAGSLPFKADDYRVGMVLQQRRAER